MEKCVSQPTILINKIIISWKRLISFFDFIWQVR